MTGFRVFKIACTARALGVTSAVRGRMVIACTSCLGFDVVVFWKGCERALSDELAGAGTNAKRIDFRICELLFLKHYKHSIFSRSRERTGALADTWSGARDLAMACRLALIVLLC